MRFEDESRGSYADEGRLDELSFGLADCSVLEWRLVDVAVPKNGPNDASSALKGLNRDNEPEKSPENSD